jgi:multidrug efflux system outer membrane protein
MNCRAIAVLIAAGWMTGCTLGPNYHRPVVQVPENFRAPDPLPAPQAESFADLKWWDVFKDPELQELVKTALQQNYDLRDAVARVEAARANLGITRSNQFPQVGATGDVQLTRLSRDGAEPLPATFLPSQNRNWGEASLNLLSFEVDLWGRLRRATEAARANLLSADENRKAVVTTLVSDVATAYFTVRELDYELEISKTTLATRQNSLNLTTFRQTGGVATLLDLRQAETSVDTARANLAQYTRQVAQDQNALVLLIGTPLPADLPPGAGLDEQQLLADLPVGLPSDLLVRRPDILAAEHNLMAANASIGAARAAFFPSITLTGNYGTASTQLSGLFDHGSTAWTFSPRISLPIFSGGANVASLNLAKVQKNVNIVQYEQTIQTAFREVADALAGRGTLDSQIAADQALVEATSDSYKLSDMRFRDGIDNYLNVLDSQRSLYTAQQTLIGVKLSRLQNLVTLYKALGGGWTERSPQDAKVAAGTQ